MLEGWLGLQISPAVRSIRTSYLPNARMDFRTFVEIRYKKDCSMRRPRGPLGRIDTFRSFPAAVLFFVYSLRRPPCLETHGPTWPVNCPC